VCAESEQQTKSLSLSRSIYQARGDATASQTYIVDKRLDLFVHLAQIRLDRVSLNETQFHWNVFAERLAYIVIGYQLLVAL
jgi:hypothetical protein